MASRQSHSGLRLLDRYQLEELLVEGGLATVYRAQDTVLRRSVVVKAVPPELIGAYRTALQTTAAFTHPAVVATYDAADHGGWLFLVQEHVQARPLTDYLRDGIPSARAVDLAGQLARALAYAHAHDVIHGDLTPVAVLVDRRAVVRINNFGLPADEDYFARLTLRARLSVLGDVAASSVPGELPDSPAHGDVHALGLLLWQLLSEPVADTSGSDDVRGFRKDVPERLRELVCRCVVNGRADAMRDAAAVAVELEHLAQEFAKQRPVAPEQIPPALRIAREAVAREASWSVEETLGGMRQWVAPQSSDSISPNAPTVEITANVTPWVRSQTARSGTPPPPPLASWPPDSRAPSVYWPGAEPSRATRSPHGIESPTAAGRMASVPDRFWIYVVLAGLTLFALFFLIGYFGPYLLGHHN